MTWEHRRSLLEPRLASLLCQQRDLLASVFDGAQASELFAATVVIQTEQHKVLAELHDIAAERATWDERWN